MPKKMGAPLRFPELTGDPLRDRIINLRRRLNLSQAALGEKLGLTDVAISCWEGGRAEPSGSSLKLLERLEKDASRAPVD